MVKLTPRPFTVAVSDDEIGDLRDRLSRTRWPDELEGAGWTYGSELQYVKDLADYWQHKYDWRQAEKTINSFLNYKVQVNGIDLHFLHERSSDPDATPLIFTHGWPGSFVEAFHIIKKLTTPANQGDQAFHVVVPSLPGFGFSSAPTRPGFGVAETARCFNELMLCLGYTKYVAQGGDLGSSITCTLGSSYSHHCKAIHLNFVDVSHGIGLPHVTNPEHVVSLAHANLPLVNMLPLGMSQEEMGYLPALNDFMKFETGYSRLQMTRPQTIGYGLNDSPTGLLAYIVEKFRAWSDCSGNLENRFTKDQILTDISIYWFNANITSSFRMYYESMGPYNTDRATVSAYVQVPVGVANFPKELFKVPQVWAESSLNIKQWSVFKTGGHFAAMEEPELLVADMRKFFSAYH